MDNSRYIVNKSGEYSFDNLEVINQSKIFRFMENDLGNLKYFPVSDNFTKFSIVNYIKYIDYIDENNEIFFLNIININDNFIKFIDYLDAENIMNNLSLYLNENSKKYEFLLKNLTYDIKIKIYSNFEYENLPEQLECDPYFLSKWL